MIKAVLFDVDGVLIDSFEANLKFFQDLMEHVGYPQPSKGQLKEIFHVGMMDAIRVFAKSASEEEIQRIYKIGHDRVVPYPSQLVKTPKGIESVLKKLKNQFSIGMVTARVRRGIFEIPVLLELKDYFDAVVAYEDTKNHKPDPEPLLLVCDKLKVNPSDAVYIGDSQTDIHAAIAAGMRSIAYQNPLEGADASIASFKELPGAILQL